MEILCFLNPDNPPCVKIQIGFTEQKKPPEDPDRKAPLFSEKNKKSMINTLGD
ncbi:MAG: hypothetical protein JW776_12050 [Candidatus Lokiarchaeota archaeon]|nr:hypothetical protein [Candidatus Lokiarchaeota archaeon]